MRASTVIPPVPAPVPRRRLGFTAALLGRAVLFGLPVLGALTLAPAAAHAQLRAESGQYEFQVLVDGMPSQTYYHNGETYVLGQGGERYTLRVINRSSRRVEAVVSVDGKDVVDGRPADYRGKRGYLVPAYGTVEIDGWRVSRGEAAAFRFSSVGSSYAGRTGSTRDVGVIGVALFPERYTPPRTVYTPYPPPPPRPYYGNRSSESAPDDYAYADKYKKESAAGPPAAAPGKTAPSSPAPEPMPPRYDGSGSAGSVLADRERRAESRPGLGTAFGERVDSPIREVAFVRQSNTPVTVLGLRYNDFEGLSAAGIDLDGPYYPYGDVRTRQSATPFPVNDRRYATPPPGWEGR